MSLGLTLRCLRKVRFRTRDEAQAALIRWRRRDYASFGDKVAYTCGLCGGAHVGTKRRKGGR